MVSRRARRLRLRHGGNGGTHARAATHGTGRGPAGQRTGDSGLQGKARNYMNYTMKNQLCLVIDVNFHRLQGNNWYMKTCIIPVSIYQHTARE